jgi:GntR family galactonate operon transcriptional repressor
MTRAPNSGLMSLHDQVTRQIALGILRGEIRNGETNSFTLDSFSRRFNVSRTVLRDSIKVLAAKGLVEARPNKGILIRPRKDWNLVDPDVLAWQCETVTDYSLVRDLCEIRLNLEPLAAELAAARARADEIESIGGWYGRMETLVHDPEGYRVADMEFHYAIYTASHNELLRQTVATLRRAFQLFQQLTHRAGFAPGTALPMHGDVAEAIRKRDRRAAHAAMDRIVRMADEHSFKAFQMEKSKPIPKSRKH